MSAVGCVCSTSQTPNASRQPRQRAPPPTIQDRQRLYTLLRDVAIHLRTNAEMFEEAEKDLRATSGDRHGRYPARAERCRELATWVEDELGALKGEQTRKVPRDDLGMFPGTLAP